MAVKKRERADILLVEQGLAPTRARAQAWVMAGRVYAGEVRIEKPGSQLALQTPLSVRETGLPYVSRGGVKLRGALDAFAPYGLDPRGKVALDIGASTGGFTDCLLQAGAVRVYAVDVGYGQLHPQLRNDPRVIVHERTHAKALTAGFFPEPIGLITVDVSFIGLAHLAPAIAHILAPLGERGELCALLKPQFEAGREVARRNKGVIRNEEERLEALQSARNALEQSGFYVVASCDCVITGPKGNREHFVYAKRRCFTRADDPRSLTVLRCDDIEDAVFFSNDFNLIEDAVFFRMTLTL